MIASISVIFIAVFGSNIDLTNGVDSMDDLELFKDVVAFYPIPQLNMQKHNASTIFKDNSKLLRGYMDSYYEDPKMKQSGLGSRGGWSYLGANNTLFYYPRDRFMTRRYNITRTYPQAPTQYINKMDGVWYKSLRDSFTDVAQNRYFFIPQRKPYNTTVRMPTKINPFIDIFNRTTNIW